MADAKLRQAIAREAARLMYERVESEYYTAKLKAARRLCRDSWCKPDDLPSNAEIRQLVQTLAHLHEGDGRLANLRAMRLAALRVMRLLRKFKPRLIGSVMTGHVRAGSDIDLHVFTDAPAAVGDALAGEGLRFQLERKLVRKHGESQVFTHIHVADRFPFELTVYPADKAHYVFKSSITGKAIERASIGELEQLIAHEYPDVDIDTLATDDPAAADPYAVFHALLRPLEAVRQRPDFHPEGDALYHSLQVFELARDHRPFDVEFLEAALLHDVGKAIDPQDHVAAALAALDGLVSDRTRFLIEHHMAAHDYRDGTLTAKKRDRLRAHPDFDELLLLSELDRAGRVPGVEVGTVDEALDFLRGLEADGG
jgi:hypothetical protein